MAQESSGQERTEDATPKRLRDARKKGQVSKSRDLNTVVILVAAFGILALMWDYMGNLLRSAMELCFQTAVRPDLNTELIFLQSKEVFLLLVRALGPFLLAIAAVSIAVSFLQVGPVFSAEPVKPQMKRLNAIENLRNMFKMTTFIELLKNLAKISLIFLLAYLVVSDALGELVMSTTATMAQSSQVALKIVTSFLIRVFIVFAVIAIIDMMVQRWQYRKQLRMTKEEVKREYKQDEGDPLIKSQRRQLHQELAMSDTKQAVSAADVIITNPTELAIAIKYNDKEMAAPTLLAKGQRLFAQAIREFAEEVNVPIVRNVPLAWSLIELDIGDEIPEELYAATAEVLAYVYRLREEKNRDEIASPS